MESVLIDMAIKGVIVLGAAGAVAAALRSASAAARHFVWTLGLTGVALLPALDGVLPGWGADFLPAVGPPPRSAGLGAPIEAGTSPWVVAWAAGALLVLVLFVVGRARVRWLARDAVALDHGSWAALATRISGEVGLARGVRLLRARGRIMPMMWGVLRPTILLPADADRWSPEFRRAVLLHELVHVKRHDYLSQVVARLACALHWFNPLVWVASRQLRLERERACDDRVLGHGTAACDYAEHLLALARSRLPGAARSVALGMAGQSPLAERLKAVLEVGRRRASLTRRAALAQGTLAALLILPLAALHPEAAPAPAGAVAEDPGILLLPPSAGAALSLGESVGEPVRAEIKPKTDAKRPVHAAEVRPVQAPEAKSAQTPEAKRSLRPQAPKPAIRTPRAEKASRTERLAPAAGITQVRYEGASAANDATIGSERLLTRVAPETESESCSGSKGDDPRIETTSHTDLVAVPPPVDTP